MKLAVIRTLAFVAACALLWPVGTAHAQGVTTGSISGIVNDAQQKPIPGASVVATHDPSGSRYDATSRTDGRFSIPGMRVGGPYSVTVSLSGFQPQTTKGVFVNLGVANDLTLTLSTATITEEVNVIAVSDPVFSSTRTGAATAVSRDMMAALPTVSDRINDFVRLSPQYSGGPFGGSFVGQDNRYNNITVDGSYFNNSFGLAGQPGDRTGVTPISSEAIEQIQVNVAPYDVRQGNFVGAGVNMVTRSGSNQFRGSAYYWFRDNGLVGTDAAGLAYAPGTFSSRRWGGWASGPILRDKLFFFASVENDSLTQPGTTFRANTGGETVAGNVTRVLASDLDQLSSYLQSNFGYATGPYQGYDFATPAKRYLGKLDYNISDRNKVSFRYTHLDSSTDVLESNSSSLGFGTRRSNTTGLNFANSNYKILENIRSGVAEWNSIIGSNMANSLIVGYTHQDESRGYVGSFFPLVDVLEGGSVYTSFGFEPFTPNNELRYNTFQAQENFTWNRGEHSLTFGASLERYKSENVFFPGAQSVYVYNSMADFYTDANDYLAHPNRTVSPVTLRIFQVRWNNIPGQVKPLQPLAVWYGGVYAQDEWQARRNVKVTYGLRLDVPFFDATGFDNPQADALSFRDETGSTVQYQSAKLPDANILWSPRAGFNWDVTGDHQTQVRGGTGIFTGPPAYVWISNQIGNTGVLTGFEDLRNTTARPFNPNPDAYKPANVTGDPASSYELALTDPSFKFPQVWRTNVAVDRKLPFGLVGTAELIYNRDVNGIYYINANQAPANTAFTGADARPRWTTSNRINANVQDAVVMKNQSVGRSWLGSLSLEKHFKGGLVKAAYSYGQSKNTVDPGSIAFGSWNGNAHPGDANNPGLAFSSASPGHRVFAVATYRLDYLNFGATTFTAFWEGITQGNASYTFSGDLNGDGGTANDLIYIPRNTSEMNFQTYTSGGVTYTADQQTAAWEAYIQQDSYLRQHRGQYAQRNAIFLPMVFRLDFSIAQELFRNLGGRRHSLTFRADFLNFSNLLHHSWGVGDRLVTTTPLITGSPVADAQGQALYRLRAVNNQLITQSLQPTAGLSDVYRIQFRFQYNFD
jgi:outer membrane receptor protein involved in Fe transport